MYVGSAVCCNVFYFHPHECVFEYGVPPCMVLYPAGDSYVLEFEEAMAGIDDSEILAARVKKETEAAETFKAKTRYNFDCIQSLHEWIFSQHMAYSSSRHDKKDTEDNKQPSSLTPEQALLLKSY